MPEADAVDNTSTSDRLVQLLDVVPPSEGRLRTFYYTVEPVRTMRASGYEWEHEVRVALPPSYADSDKALPVLWMLDNALELALSALQVIIGPPLIIVSVGAGPGIPLRESAARRVRDFFATEDRSVPGPDGDYMDAYEKFGLVEVYSGAGAQTFLNFLIDDVRPALESQYRMAPDDHVLFGHSHGGMFATYAIFARPGAFSRYICSSPTLYFGDGRLFELEQQYAAIHDDLPAHVFFGAGEDEMTSEGAEFGFVSSMAKMAETLSFRGYPSLQLTAKIFPGESHQTVTVPLLRSAVRSLWAG
jgi:predicted alpha/beta superfamily hydrolase